MRPTNYHLFDFLDFDTELSKDESLWKAYSSPAVNTINGDIHITIPFQKQQLSNDMMADTSVAIEEYTLILRQYTQGILRLFVSFDGEEMSDTSEMLQFSARINTMPLHAIKTEKGWSIQTDNKVVRAVINTRQGAIDHWSDLLPNPQETFDLRLYPMTSRIVTYDQDTLMTVCIDRQ